MSMALDPFPLARANDPVTSVDAGRSVNLPQAMSEVLSLLLIHERLADHELVAEADRWGIQGTPQRLRSARAQLVERRIVRMVPDEFRVTPHGRRAHVWELAS